MSHLGFYDDEDDDYVKRALSKTIDYGAERSFGGDDESCPFDKPSHFGIPRYDVSRCRGDSDDDVDRSSGSDYFPAAAAAVTAPSSTIHDAFRHAFSKRK
jgi:hypothetical protein